MTQPPELEDSRTRTVSGLRWLVAAVLFIAVICAFFDRISIAVLFTNKSFQHDIGTGFNPALLGMLMTAFLFAYGAWGLR